MTESTKGTNVQIILMKFNHFLAVNNRRRYRDIILGSLSNDDGNGNENVTWKSVTSRYFYCSGIILFRSTCTM